MAFNVEEFRSTINKYGYGVTNLFMVQITSPGVNGMGDRDLTFFCRSATLPEFDIQTNEIAHTGFGSATRKPSNIQFPIVPLTFLVDTDHKVLEYFHNWAQKIVNYDRSSGPSGIAPNGAFPFELGYKEDYQGTVIITVFPRFNGRRAYRYELSGAYPINIGSITTAWDSDDLMLLPVGFTYDVVKVTGMDTAKVTSDFSGANSLLTYFSSLNTVVKAFESIRRPSDVQNLVNIASRDLLGSF